LKHFGAFEYKERFKPTLGFPNYFVNAIFLGKYMMLMMHNQTLNRFRENRGVTRSSVDGRTRSMP
jgi:hypothetical protein